MMIEKILMLLIFLSFFIICLYNLKKKGEKATLIVVLLVLSFSLSILFACREFIFSSNVIGTDYFEYKHWFEITEFSNIYSDVKYENIGFDFIISLIKYLGGNFYIFLFISAFFINTSILFFIKRFSKNIGLSIIIYISLFYTSTWNVTRQWIACAIFLIAFKYLIDKKSWKYIIIVFISSLFHITSLILLILYPLSKLNNKAQKVIINILIVLVFVIVIFVTNIDTALFNLSGLFKSLNYSYKYQDYIGQYSNYTSLIYGLASIFAMMLYDRINNSNNKIESKDAVYTYSICYFLVGALAIKSFIFSRFIIYFSPAAIIALPYLVQIANSKSKNIIKSIMYLVLISKIVFEGMMIL